MIPIFQEGTQIHLNGNTEIILAPAGSGSRNTSAAGSLTTNAAATEEARLSFSLTYPPEVGNIDISGAISVTPLIKISTQSTQFSPRT